MRRLLRFLFPTNNASESQIGQIKRRREELGKLGDEALKAVPRANLVETLAVAAVVVARVLGLGLFEVQIQGALRDLDLSDKRSTIRHMDRARGPWNCAKISGFLRFQWTNY